MLILVKQELSWGIYRILCWTEKPEISNSFNKRWRGENHLLAPTTEPEVDVKVGLDDLDSLFQP